MSLGSVEIPPHTINALHSTPSLAVEASGLYLLQWAAAVREDSSHAFKIRVNIGVHGLSDEWIHILAHIMRDKES